MLELAKVFSVTVIMALIGLYEWPKIDRTLKKERVVFVIISIVTLLVSSLIVVWPRQNTLIEFILRFISNYD